MHAMYIKMYIYIYVYIYIIYILFIYIYIYIKTTKLISLAMSQCNSTTPCVPSVGHPDFGS